MNIFLSDIKLPGESEFAKKFNIMSDLWARYKETDKDEDYQEWFQYKFNLEIGAI